MSETVIWIGATAGRPADRPYGTPVECQEIVLLSLAAHLGADRRAGSEVYMDDYSVTKPDYFNDAPSDAKLYLKVVTTAKFANGAQIVGDAVQAWLTDAELYTTLKALRVQSGDADFTLEPGADGVAAQITALAG